MRRRYSARTYSQTANFVLIFMSLVLTTSASALASDTLTVLSSFNGEAGYGGSGYSPMGDLVFDSAGNLYGTTSEGAFEGPNCTYNCGTVFELSPSDGGWTYQVIHFFSGGVDGGEPHSRLTLDSQGNLYGTANIGGTVNEYCPIGCGTVFELSPSGGDWTLTVLHSFDGTDGSVPGGGLTLDGAGNLYGTTSSTVFELSPSGEGWKLSTLYAFPVSGIEGEFPAGYLVLDGAGNLYGAAQQGGSFKPGCGGCGTVFELSPSEGGWTFSLLHTFQGIKPGAKLGDGIYPWGALAIDSEGNVYGATFEGGGECSGGTVFKVSQSTGKWREQIVHRFGCTNTDGVGPLGGVILDRAGNLYGTTLDGGTDSCGTVFKLTPNRKGSGWKFTSLSSFTDGTDGGLPYAGVVVDAAGNLYGTTTFWGPQFEGTLFELSPP